MDELHHSQMLVGRLRKELAHQTKRADKAESRISRALDALIPHPVYRQHFDWDSAEQCVTRACRLLADPEA